MILKPKKLQPGDTIGIVTPASPMLSERLTRGIQYLQQRGFQVKIGEHVSDERGYLAGSDEARAQDLNELFANSEVDAIFCTRGGYGTPRLLDQIDYTAIKAHPKILVGYSDITALQLALFRKAQLVSFSGPMVAVEMCKGVDQVTERHFWQMLTEPTTKARLIDLNDAMKIVKGGQATGRLLGGCLSLICSLLGSRFVPDFRNAILILEDRGEEPYKIDRMLTQLRLCGILNQINGLIFGQFVECDPKSTPSLSFDEVVKDLTADLDIPIIAEFPYGHLDVKYTIPIGVEACLNADDGFLEMLESPVL